MSKVRFWCVELEIGGKSLGAELRESNDVLHDGRELRNLHVATGLFYVMEFESCSIYTKSSAWWEPGRSFYGGGARNVTGEDPHRNRRDLGAVSARHRRTDRQHRLGVAADRGGGAGWRLGRSSVHRGWF